MGLLDGDISAKVYAAFKGKLLSGVIRQVTAPVSGSLDEFGDPQAGVPLDTPCEGFTDEYSDFFRAQVGIPDNDIKVMIFAKSIPGIVPSKDACVGFARGDVVEWHQLRGPRKLDAAGALWECQATRLDQEPRG